MVDEMIKDDPREIYEIPFPDELAGEIIEGIDLQMTVLDSLRITDAFAKNNELSEIQCKVLNESLEELNIIINNIDETYRSFFIRVRIAVRHVLSYFMSNQRG